MPILTLCNIYFSYTQFSDTTLLSNNLFSTCTSKNYDDCIIRDVWVHQGRARERESWRLKKAEATNLLKTKRRQLVKTSEPFKLPTTTDRGDSRGEPAWCVLALRDCAPPTSRSPTTTTIMRRCFSGFTDRKTVWRKGSWAVHLVVWEDGFNYRQLGRIGTAVWTGTTFFWST